MAAVLVLVSDSEAATERIGIGLAQYFRAGDIVSLDGDLGAGKTALTRGIAQGLGLTSPVSSPTFTLVIEHRNDANKGLSLYHFDVYRLTDSEDFVDAGLDEYFDLGGVCVIEWGKQVEGILPEGFLRISLQGDDQVRRLEIVFPDSRQTELDEFSCNLKGDKEIHIA